MIALVCFNGNLQVETKIRYPIPSHGLSSSLLHWPCTPFSNTPAFLMVNPQPTYPHIHAHHGHIWCMVDDLYLPWSPHYSPIMTDYICMFLGAIIYTVYTYIYILYIYIIIYLFSVESSWSPGEDRIWELQKNPHCFFDYFWQCHIPFPSGL